MTAPSDHIPDATKMVATHPGFAKLQALREYAEDLQERFRRPAVLWSGGKDSTAMLWALRQMGFHWPVITFMEPWLPWKWTYVQELAAQMGLELHTWAPASTWIYERGTQVVLGASWDIGAGELCGVPKDVVEPDGADLPPGYFCGLKAITRPRSWLDGTPWDVLLCGHKDVDTDPVLGAIPLRTQERAPDVPGGPVTVFPLKDWTDAEVWGYLLEQEVPVDWRRYEMPRDTAPMVVPRSLSNPQNTDVLHACVNCLKQCGTGGQVYCPIEGGPVDSLAAQVARMPTLRREHFDAEVRDG